MIVKVFSKGKSFKSLARYLTHDPHATTDDRVPWTHTRNLANDHVNSAVDEMLWTYRNAELLKQEAGVRAGGRATETPVKHFSLNWSPTESPTREQMIDAADDFLRHMKWDEHQAVLVAHQDKEHHHVHVMLNVVHPETGLKLGENFEYRRAQKWALEYEREHGNIFCEQRLENPENREQAPTRPMWTAFDKDRREFEKEEKQRAEEAPDPADPEHIKKVHAADWRWLKDFQRNERKEFFADGKKEFSDVRQSVYREVREEFRPLWADYFASVKEGGDSEELKKYKADLVAEQKAALDIRREAAFKELREERNYDFRILLDHQQHERGRLRWHHENLRDTNTFLSSIEDGSYWKEKTGEFRAAGEKTTAREEKPGEQREPQPDAQAGATTSAGATKGKPDRQEERAGMRSGMAIGSGLGLGLATGIGSIAASVSDGLTGTRKAPRPKPYEPSPSERHNAQYDDDTAAKERRRHESEVYRTRQEDRYWE